MTRGSWVWDEAAERFVERQESAAQAAERAARAEREAAATEPRPRRPGVVTG